MGFYGNAAVELRTNASTCRVLGRTVVLAEGLTGADALAAGWWTSFWQVPVLLHDGSSTLPTATANALSTLGVDNVIVLGGPARIPGAVLTQVGDLTGADVTRLAGSDRYATSVGDGTDASAAGSRTAGPTSTPDPSSAWPRRRATGRPAADGPTRSAPARGAGQPTALLLAPRRPSGRSPRSPADSRESPSTTPGSPHDAVPVLLVPAGATTLPASVRQLLTGAFEPTDSFCSSVQAPAGCVMPGFVVAAGGATVLPSALIDSAAQLVAGGAPSSGAAPPAALAQPFYTSLDLAPVYATDAGLPDHVCAARDSYRRLEMAHRARRRPVDVRDRQSPTPCSTAATSATPTASPARAASAPRSAHRSPREPERRCVPEASASPDASDRSRASPPHRPTGSSSPRRWSTPAPTLPSGTNSSDNTSNGGSTTQTYITLAPTVGAISKGSSAPVTSASITFTITRGTDTPSSTGVDRFTATTSFDTPNGTVTATATGEALFVGGIVEDARPDHRRRRLLELRRRVRRIRRRPRHPEPRPMTDDSIAWRLDATQTS